MSLFGHGRIGSIFDYFRRTVAERRNWTYLVIVYITGGWFGLHLGIANVDNIYRFWRRIHWHGHEGWYRGAWGSWDQLLSSDDDQKMIRWWSFDDRWPHNIEKTKSLKTFSFVWIHLASLFSVHDRFRGFSSHICDDSSNPRRRPDTT